MSTQTVTGAATGAIEQSATSSQPQATSHSRIEAQQQNRGISPHLALSVLLHQLKQDVKGPCVGGASPSAAAVPQLLHLVVGPFLGQGDRVPRRGLQGGGTQGTLGVSADEDARSAS